MILVLLLPVLNGVIFAETVGYVDLEDTFPEITFFSAVVNKPNINESSMFSSNLKNQQIPYKSKYKLRKNVISGKVSSKSTFPTVSANITPFSTGSNKTKIIKSKYHLRKVDISKSSKVHSVLPHLKKDLHVRQLKQLEM
jgi:hypothetical protein